MDQLSELRAFCGTRCRAYAELKRVINGTTVY